MKPLIPKQAIVPILLLSAITVLVSTCGTASAADKPAVKPADDKKTDAAAKPYPLKTCIVSDNDLDSMGEQASFVYQGQTIKVCCKPCIAKFEKNPAKYLKKLEGK